MSASITEIDPVLGAWLESQHIFFVATAPSSTEGHVNCSPKGGDSFRVLGPHEVAYLDYAGSGAETAAHLRENGRIAVMFCAFDGKPKIVRLHGTGSVLTEGDEKFNVISSLFPPSPATRSVVSITVSRVSSSCGFAVPLMDFKAERDQLTRWAEAKGRDGLAEYQLEKNAVSIDGLPAFSK